MKTPTLLRLFLLLLSAALSPHRSQAAAATDEGLVISEFLANNATAVKDDNGNASDFVEIYNGSPNTINLGTYYLTDTQANLKQWQFPSTNLFSGQHLLVWASGTSKRLPGLPLHANFKLNANGEEIWLVRSDASLVHGYVFGPQALNRSYGLASETISSSTLVAAGVAARYLVPTNNVNSISNAVVNNRWFTPAFDDTQWTPGVSGFGFDTNPISVFTPFIGTDVRTPMQGGVKKQADIYVRIPFILTDLASVSNPLLQIRYDDGFVAYLNGVEIARRGIDTNKAAAYNSLSLSSRSNSLVIIPESISSLYLSPNLVLGTNILAVQGANKSITDGDLLLLPEIVTSQIRYLSGTNNERYFTRPSPGSPNGVGFDGASGEVLFSASSSTFFDNFELVLTPKDPTALSQIRYTVNSSAPTTNSILYTGPIQMTNSAAIRAKVFETGLLPGLTRSEGFVKLAPALQTTSSDLPLIIVHSFGESPLTDQDVKHPAFFYIFETKQGRSSFTNAPDQIFRAGVRIRGSSTSGNPKSNWAVEPWDEDDLSKDIPLLGMPKGSPWVFHAPFNFDPSLFHNPLASDMSNEVGSYASRYRFAELYLDTIGAKATATDSKATVTAANYFGVYNILEHIDVSPNRVNVDKLAPGDVNEPEVSGGYLLSIDRALGSDPTFAFGRQDPVILLNPDARHIVPAQLNFLTTWFGAFGTNLFAKDFTNGAYRASIDQPAWIDHHIINVISCNVDGMRLSGYFHKLRNGPIVYGPVWDFDRSFGSTDGRDSNPAQWRGTGDSTYFFTTGSSPNLAWWPQLFKDINFWQAWIDRFQELREAQYSTPNLFALMDRLNGQVRESAARDLARWGNAKRGGNQDSEVVFFKNWVQGKLKFMDGNFLDKPALLTSPGQVALGSTIELTAPAGATLYYSLDGTDPRAVHGGISPTALIYTGPISVTGETRLIARAYDIKHKNLNGGSDNPPLTSPWSGPRQARFTLDAGAAAGDLIVSELNYHPVGPNAAELLALPLAVNDDFQFIEVKNVSNHRVDFYGAMFTQGVGFNFKNATIYALEANASLLLVKDSNAFALRYGAKPNIAGVFTGAFNPGSKRLRLETAEGIQLFDFSYSDSWYPTTDGLGYTLVRRSLAAGDSSREAWGPSSAVGGSPGVENPSPAVLPFVVINEVLANSDSLQIDTVELLNRSAVPAEVSGWYITDDRAVPTKYRIPANTIISPGGFLTIDENAFNAGGPDDPKAFQLSSRGDAIWLFSADSAGNLLPYSHGFTFGPSESNTSFGRYLISTGKELFVAQTSLTLGKANTGPKIGPAVITEIHYHPSDTFANGEFWNNDREEFIEIQNISLAALPMEDSVLVNGLATSAEWHLRGSVYFNFPTALTLAAGERIVIVGFDPATEPDQLAAFRNKFNVPAGVKVLGPFQGNLNNLAGDVHLSRPGPVNPSTGGISYVVVDLVQYEDTAPWPTAADGTGGTLQRKTGGAFGNDPASWIAALPTAGAGPGTGAGPTLTQQPESKTVVGGTHASLTVKALGSGQLLYQWRFKGGNIPGATSSTLDLDPVLVSQTGEYQVIVLDANGSVSSQTAILTVLQPALITHQPETLNVKPGLGASFTVTAIGTGKLSYQWYFHGKPLSGATAATLSLSNVQLAESGDYTVTVTDSIGSSTSDPARLNVLVRPIFLSQPSAQTAVVGDTVQFEVVLDGLSPFSYQWKRGTTKIANATNRVLRLVNVQLSNAVNYVVTITNLATSNSGTNSLSVPLIVMSDFDADHMGDAWEVANGYSTNNAADALMDDDGDGFSNLQEFLAGTNPKDKNSYLKIDSIAHGAAGTQVGFTGRTSRGYTLQFRAAVDRGDWQVADQVPGRTNDAALVAMDSLPDSAARLYRIITPHQYDLVDSGPTILSPPASTSSDLGDSATFEVAAAGIGDLSYQWVKGTSDIPGATSSTFVLPSTTLTDAGSYAARVTDDSGTTLSGTATLTVLQKPVITQQPLGQTLNSGATLVLTVQATGVGTLTYQWLYNDHLIAGSTGATFTLPKVTPGDAGSYRVSVSVLTPNGIQRRSSATALVRVNE